MPRVVVFVIMLMVFSLSHHQAFAAVFNKIESAELDLSIGHRVDQFDWNIAGNSDGKNPNVLSQLTWSDLELIQLQLDGRIELSEVLWTKIDALFVGRFAYGNAITGLNRDSDYAGDNRTLEWSRSINQSDDGFTVDITGGIGHKFELIPKLLSVAPLIGYAFNVQNLTMSEGVQTVSDDVIHDLFFEPDTSGPWPIGSIPALDSSYRAYWFGPWLGLNIDLTPIEKLKIELLGEFHWVEYFAEANWNLRTQLVHPISFEHEAHGTGLVGTVKTSYQLNDRWSLLFSGTLQYWRTGDGIDTTYFTDGTRGGTRLNEVNWDSYAAMVGLRYQF